MIFTNNSIGVILGGFQNVSNKNSPRSWSTVNSDIPVNQMLYSVNWFFKVWFQQSTQDVTQQYVSGTFILRFWNWKLQTYSKIPPKRTQIIKVILKGATPVLTSWCCTSFCLIKSILNGNNNISPVLICFLPWADMKSTVQIFSVRTTENIERNVASQEWGLSMVIRFQVLLFSGGYLVKMYQGTYLVGGGKCATLPRSYAWVK